VSAGRILRGYARRAAWLACLCAAVAGASAQPPAAVLREGQPQSATQTAEQRFRYDVELGAGTYLVRVEQRGLDLKVVVESPGGATETLDSGTFRDGDEVAILSGPGRYRVEVYSDESTNARGGHTVSLANVTNLSASELAAWRLVAAAGVANFAGGDEGWANAADAYARAAELWRGLGRTREEADALFAAATVEYWQRLAWQLSADLAARAAELYGQLGEAPLAANALHLEGAALVEQALEVRQSSEAGAPVAAESEALFGEALRLLEEARATHERLGRIYDLGLVLNNFGYTYFNKGESARARPYYEQAAALFGSVGEWGAQVQPLANAAVVDMEEGRLASAIATFEEMLEVMPPGKLRARRAVALENLGATHLLRGDAEVALGIFAQALDLSRSLDDEHGESRALRRIGEAYFTLGELDLAEQYLQQALPLAERTNEARTREAVLRNLGNVAYSRRDYEAALGFHRRALEASVSVSDRAYLQVLVTKDLIALGRPAEARAAAAEGHSVAASSGSERLLAVANVAVGRADVAAGEPSAAVPRLESAAAAFARFGMHAERADALHALALAARAASLDTALAHGEAALDELELMRSRVADPALRAMLASTRRDYYETQIDLLMARARSERNTAAERDSYARAALEVSERGRARMIADLIQEGAIDLRRGAGAAVRAREDQLYEQLADLRRRRDLLLEGPMSDPKKAAELERAVADLAAVENQLNLVEIDLRRSNPQYANLTAPATLTATEMQRALGADTVLLQYALGDSASWVWVVTAERVAAVELADRATIETAARRALARLEKYSPDPTLRSTVELEELAALVIAPVADSLNRPRIALALDGALQFVPFSALPRHGSGGAAAPLLAQHEVIEVPSLSALTLSARGAAPAQRKTLAVFADPVLEPSDPRFGAARPELLAAAANAHGFAARSSAVDLGRLLSTGYEGEAIAALVPDGGGVLARGFAANRDAVLQADLEGFRYIHFATHGLVDARYPGLSALVLSQFDEQGRPLDGFLRLNDIYNLKLGADLVVLSACETALGREIRGEGLIGLTQGFMTAGARTVVASLWQVPDRATAELMRQFYGYMLNDGLTPAAALRKAQLDSAAQRRWSDPYFWGGFVLVGDWR
jgi:CHAT domain-containing protein/tetratricopeptide (TPR) repeat protein